MDRNVERVTVSRANPDDPESPCAMHIHYDAVDGSGSSQVLTPVASLEDVWEKANALGVDRAAVHFKDDCQESLAAASDASPD